MAMATGWSPPLGVDVDPISYEEIAVGECVWDHRVGRVVPVTQKAERGNRIELRLGDHLELVKGPRAATVYRIVEG
jgi:hypothetical protein